VTRDQQRSALRRAYRDQFDVEHIDPEKMQEYYDKIIDKQITPRWAQGVLDL
jgi:hypothetical protein